MKKLTSLVLAIASTMFLAVGAARAAGQFDSLTKGNIHPATDSVMDGPTNPCGGGDGGDPGSDPV